MYFGIIKMKCKSVCSDQGDYKTNKQKKLLQKSDVY